MRRKSKVEAAEAVETIEAAPRPFVAPSNAVKSGCRHCPLAAFHKDFDSFSTTYAKNGDKLRAKLKVPHVIENRNVTEPWTEVDVLVVGDTPGRAEDKSGVPFSGKAGQFYQDAVVGDEKVLGAIKERIPDVRVGYTYLVRCPTPLGRDPNNTEINCCGVELIREINVRKPKIILAAGGRPLEFLTGSTGILNLAGKLMVTRHPQLSEIPLIPTFTASYVMRFDHETDKFLQSISLAADFLLGEYKPKAGIGDYRTLTDVDEIVTMLTDWAKSDKVVAFDTETGSLSPFDDRYPKLLCVSFSDTEGTGVVIPIDHKESPFKLPGKDRTRITAALRLFFLSTTVKRLAQNEKFDRKHLRKFLGVEIGPTRYDTMLTHMLLDETRGSHGLKSMAYAATGMGGYDDELDQYKEKHPECEPKKGGSYANIPGKTLFWYGAADADCTLRVFNWLCAQEEYTSNAKFRAQAEVFLPALSETLARMEYAGATVNPDRAAEIDADLEIKINAAMASVHADPCVLSFVADQKAELAATSPKKSEAFAFNPGSTANLGLVLFDYYNVRPTGLTDRGLNVLNARWVRAIEDRKLEPEQVDFSEFVTEACVKREWDLFTTDADALNAIARKTNNPLVEHILEYREHATMRSTFINPLLHRLDADNRVHGSYNLGGTTTGRLSSSDPNLQNIGGIAKECYVSRFGDEGLLLQADYSQIELRVAAAWYGEPKMIKAYVNKEDLHALTAQIISGLSADAYAKLDKKAKKEWRARAKRVNFLSLYGGGPPALQATLRKDGVFVELEECEKFLRDFFKGYTGLARGMDRARESCKRDGYLESFTGRRRRFPEVASVNPRLVARALRQGINFPIQGAAGEMTLMALTLCDRYLRKAKMRSIPVLTVHDSIVFDAHVDEFLEVANVAKQVMENLPELSDEVMPGLNWKWMNVPIVAEFEVGPTWGTGVEFDPEGFADAVRGVKPLIGPGDDGVMALLRKPTNVDELWEVFAFNAEKN